VFFNKALQEIKNTKGMYKYIAQEDRELNIEQHVVQYYGPGQGGGREGGYPLNCSCPNVGYTIEASNIQMLFSV
jgi:hypothetical protein